MRNVEISFYVPVAVGVTVAALISRLVDDFERGASRDPRPADLCRHLSGCDGESAHRPAKSGTPPDLAVLFAADLYTLIDADAIVPFDDVSVAARLDPAWMESFYRR